MNKNTYSLYRNLCINNNINIANKNKIMTIQLIIPLFAIISFVILICTKEIIAMFVFMILIIVWTISLISGNNKMNIEEGIYREKVIGEVLKQTITGAEYFVGTGFSEKEYKTMEFSCGNSYKVRENIKLPFKKGKINISNVCINDECNDGDTDLIFDGYVFEFDIPKKIFPKIKVVYNAFNIEKYDNVVSIDNRKMNEKYNVLCEDEIYAVRMLTSENILKIMDLYNKYRYIIDLHINGSKVYMRTRKEVGINDWISYKYKDIENKMMALEFIVSMAEIVYNIIEEFED